MSRSSQTIKPQNRRSFRIQGQVQGVGFRPFVYRLACDLKLAGFIRNEPEGVVIEVQGPHATILQFTSALKSDQPTLTRYDQVVFTDIPPIPSQGEASFQIIASVLHHRGEKTINKTVTIDSAVCSDCLTEMRDPENRRHRYGLINCTNCGPRFSIINAVPYDRPNTSMAHFGMCPNCMQEYTNPADRRFHAQPTACHHCGPTVSLVDNRGVPLDGDPYCQAAAILAAGRIIAIKGIGGFHLCVRADDRQAVERLRLLKQREHKPLAVLCRNTAVAQSLVHLSDQALQALQSNTRPIVLAMSKLAKGHARGISGRLAGGLAGVADDTDRLGVMLPYTPMQHLLFDALADLNCERVDVLVMTSANISNEPLIHKNDDALKHLSSLCDAILWHDRPIVRSIDDSVLMTMQLEGQPQKLLPLRRARGYVPTPLTLPSHVCVPGLCVGGELKNTVALVRGNEVILSHHIGDLTYTRSYEYFQQVITDLCKLHSIKPQWIAHDMHPVYLSTQYARRLAAKWDVRMLAVQHHHAHAAAVLAEHGITEPALALVCDGVGFGEDDTSWGGELILSNVADFYRMGYLKPLQLPGGDSAAKDTRRCGLAWLAQLPGIDLQNSSIIAKLITDIPSRVMLTNMIEHKVNVHTSSSAGRYFDATAAILGICNLNQYEAQSPMMLEAIARTNRRELPCASLYKIRHGVLDLTLLLECLILEDTDAAYGADLFHQQLARGLAELAITQATQSKIDKIALSGGVFCNELLTQRVITALRGANLNVFTHQLVPANDGGLAYGQAAVTSARIGGPIPCV
ncbi:MAG: carbamoyltransferase HypF [Phycisphaeraceae bacterium]|nr:carbamoyltransferase HypF [Phycisphaeraceae bacterium]